MSWSGNCLGMFRIYRALGRSLIGFVQGVQDENLAVCSFVERKL